MNPNQIIDYEAVPIEKSTVPGAGEVIVTYADGHRDRYQYDLKSPPDFSGGDFGRRVGPAGVDSKRATEWRQENAAGAGSFTLGNTRYDAHGNPIVTSSPSPTVTQFGHNLVRVDPTTGAVSVVATDAGAQQREQDSYNLQVLNAISRAEQDRLNGLISLGKMSNDQANKVFDQFWNLNVEIPLKAVQDQRAAQTNQMNTATNIASGVRESGNQAVKDQISLLGSRASPEFNQWFTGAANSLSSATPWAAGHEFPTLTDAATRLPPLNLDAIYQGGAQRGLGAFQTGMANAPTFASLPDSYWPQAIAPLRSLALENATGGP